MTRIDVVGHLCIDLTPSLSADARFAPGQLIQTGPLETGLGGSVANTGTTLADLGVQVTMQGSVGDDALGTLAEDLLGGRARLQIIPGGSTSYSIVLERDGEDRTFWHHTGVNERFETSAVEITGDCLHLGYPALLPGTVIDEGRPIVQLFERARSAGVTCSIDHAVVDHDAPIGKLDWPTILRVTTACADVVSPSVDDLASMTDPGPPATIDSAEAWASQLLDWGAAVALVTAGPEGAVLKSASLDRVRAGGKLLAELGPEWDHARVVLPGRAVDAVVTTTGAGDASSAGLLAALAHGCRPETAAQIARATSERIMTGRRPDPALLKVIT